ncbi:MAG: hypothetical protein ABUT20_41785 [Bacteroidota bacterium]
MAYKFLYIDDTQNEIEKGTIHGLQDGEEIKVDFMFPIDWESQMKELIGKLPNYNGVILDLRLNDNAAPETGLFAHYRGSSIAQELRTLAKENEFKNDFPIVLISANENMEKSFDQTSLDLFDFLISKNTIGNDRSGISYAAFRDKLKWLADGYNYLNQIGQAEKNINNIIKKPDNVVLDFRFVEQFTKLIEKPVHVVARFLNKEVISRPTFLINEQYLSARLGVDINSEEWKPFLEKYLSEAKYNGAFSNYYPRWWMSGLEKFWQSMDTELSLRNTSAAKKIELLIAKTEFKNLKAIEKNEKNKSDCYWVVCKATGVPIDTIDGFIIAGQDDNYPWQESEYITLQEALRPTKHYGVSVSEKARLQKLKELFEKNEQRIRQ